MNRIKITEQELLLRKNRIIDEAFQLFCRRGIDRVSMRDIARQSGVSEKSVYRYFNTKTELLLATLRMLWTEIVRELGASIDDAFRHQTGYGQIELLLQGFRNLFENHSQYVLFAYDYKLFLIRHSARFTIDEYDDVLRPMRELYLQALRKGMEDGSINARVEPQRLYYAIWGLMRGYVVKMVIYEHMYEDGNLWRDQYDTACALILSGLRHGLTLPGAAGSAAPKSPLNSTQDTAPGQSRARIER